MIPGGRSASEALRAATFNAGRRTRPQIGVYPV